MVLCNRFGQAKDMVHTTSEYYSKFTLTVSAGALKKWTKEIELAESKRLKDPRAMDIMRAHQTELTAEPAPSGPSQNRSSAMATQWLNLALSIEERQYVYKDRFTFTISFFNRIDVRDRVKRLQKEPREDCRLEVERLRRILTTDLILLQSLHSALNNAAARNDVEDPRNASFEEFDDDDGEAESFVAYEVFECTDPDLDLPPERVPLHLPSSHDTPARHKFRPAELDLRVKQATRYLAALRDAIAQKSFQYSHVMRSAPSKGVRTRSRTAIIRINDQVAQFSRVYCQARAAMVRLGVDERTLTKFKLLSRDDVKASTAILDPNIPGSSTIRLSWIWETGPRVSGSAPDAIRECKLALPIFIAPCIDSSEVQRVHWIRARAQKYRWEEELMLVKYEMEWTTRYFLHKARQWQDRFEEPNIDRGPKAYAARQSSQWRRMAWDADRLFRSANAEYISLIK